MTEDIREQLCGTCRSFRPSHNICGRTLPEVKIWGTVQNQETGLLEPLYGTFRAEVLASDPCCAYWEPYGEPTVEEMIRQEARSPICAYPGCKCLRDGESDFCVEHEPEEDMTEAAEAFKEMMRPTYEHYGVEMPDDLKKEKKAIE